MTSPLTNLTPERAKELREMADDVWDRDFQTQITAALRDYATLIDTVLDGGDVVTAEVVELGCIGGYNAQDMGPFPSECVNAEGERDYMRAALTAALPAIRLRLLADTAKEGTK